LTQIPGPPGGPPVYFYLLNNQPHICIGAVCLTTSFGGVPGGGGGGGPGTGPGGGSEGGGVGIGGGFGTGF
jgi:hypothetical protein